MFLNLRNTYQVDRTHFLFKQAKKLKIGISFVNDDNVMQKQGVLNFDRKDQKSTCRRHPVTNNERITYVHDYKQLIGGRP